MNKIIGIIILVVTGLTGIWYISRIVVSDNNYANEIGNYWELADRSSTLQEKSKYIDKFVEALKQSKHASYNAIWLFNPEVSFDKNLEALESLQRRLTEIQGMNPSSFEYQTAMQQITAQEQGEANAMLHVFNGCWYLENYPYLWGWISAVLSISLFALLITGIVLLINYYN